LRVFVDQFCRNDFLDYFLNDIIPDLLVSGFRVMLRGNDHIGDALGFALVVFNRYQSFCRPAAGKG